MVPIFPVPALGEPLNQPDSLKLPIQAKCLTHPSARRGLIRV